MRRGTRSEHKTIHKYRKVCETMCAEPGCEFNGKHAAQGICFSKLSRNVNAYIVSVMNQGEHLLKEMKSLRKANKLTTDKAWIKYLEGHVACEWANNMFHLDELISLRAEVSRLGNKLSKK